MKIKSAIFLKSAVNPNSYPPEQYPEIAFAGRSNVGKSSLINALVNRKKLAKTSSTPGHTRLLNFYLINDQFVFVDLPGFGYAKVPMSVRKQWGQMIETFLSSRKTLKSVILIMDIRRSPGTEEIDLIKWFDFYHIPKILVLTKADKLSKNQQLQQQIAISRILVTPKENLIIFSATSKQGRDQLWEKIEKAIYPDKSTIASL